MLRVAGEIFESRKKKSRIKKYPDTCERGFGVMSQNPNNQQKSFWTYCLLTVFVSKNFGGEY